MAFLSEICQKLNTSRINMSNILKSQMELKFKDACTVLNLRTYLNLSRLSNPLVNRPWQTLIENSDVPKFKDARTWN